MLLGWDAELADGDRRQGRFFFFFGGGFIELRVLLDVANLALAGHLFWIGYFLKAYMFDLPSNLCLLAPMCLKRPKMRVVF